MRSDDSARNLWSCTITKQGRRLQSDERVGTKDVLKKWQNKQVSVKPQAEEGILDAKQHRGHLELTLSGFWKPAAEVDLAGLGL